MKRLIAFALLFVTSAYAASIDDQIATLQAKSDSLQREAWTLESQKLATVLDSTYQANAVLGNAQVRVVKAWASPEWVKVTLTHLSSVNRKLVKADLQAANIDFQAVASDTLYFRHDWAEKALPVIEAALSAE